MWKAAVLWNAVLDMNYMVASTDIPDWILACTKNEEINFANLTGQDRLLFHERSPICNVKNVKTPSMFLVGDADLRVPPHQSYYFHSALKQMGVESQLHNYPGSGHALLTPEHGFDAATNIMLWFDKYLLEPYEEDLSNDDLSEAQIVLKKVQRQMEKKPNSTVMLNYFKIPECMKKFQENNVKTKKEIHDLTDEKLLDYGLAEGLITKIRELLALSEQEY